MDAEPRECRQPRVTIVIPVVDGAGVIRDTITTLRNDLADFDADGLELVVVDDGSTDDTAAEARAAGADAVIQHDHNRGKGAAVKTGFAASHGQTVAFTDADLAYAPEQVRHVVESVEVGADVAIGSRAHPASQVVEDPRPLRRLASRPFNAMTRIALGHVYADTQCGLKAFTAEAAHLFAREMRIDGFAFDVELLHLAERHRMKVVEVPVEPTHVNASTVRLFVHVPEMLWDVLRIRRNERTGAYSRAAP